jgi:hypothetical protein
MYRERLQVVNSLVEERKNELIEEALTSKNSERIAADEAAKLKNDVEQSIFQVSQKFKGLENFEQLMFGKQVQNRNGELEFQRGTGADLVEAIIDIIYDQQQIGDVKKAYVDGWNRIAKKPEILGVIAKYVSGYHVARNLNKNNKMVRAAALQEERNRQKLVKSPTQSTIPSSTHNSGTPDVLKNWGISTV